MARINDAQFQILSGAAGRQNAAEAAVSFEVAFDDFENSAESYDLYISVTDVQAAAKAPSHVRARAPIGFNKQAHAHEAYYRFSDGNYELLLVLAQARRERGPQADSYDYERRQNGHSENGQYRPQDPLARDNYQSGRREQTLSLLTRQENGAAARANQSAGLSPEDNFTLLSVRERIEPGGRNFYNFNRSYPLKRAASPSQTIQQAAAGPEYAAIEENPRQSARARIFPSFRFSETPGQGWWLGYGPEELQILTLLDLVDKEERVGLMNTLTGISPEDPGGHALDMTLLGKSGRKSRFEVEIDAFFDEYDRPTEYALRFEPGQENSSGGKNDLAGLFADAVGVPALITDASGRIEWCNRAFEQAAGVEGRRLLRKSYEQFFDYVEFGERDRRAYAVAGPPPNGSVRQPEQPQAPAAQQVEFRGPRRAQSMQLRLEPLQARGGRNRWLWTFGGEHSGGAKPGGDYERLRKMVDKAPVGVCVTDEKGYFVQVNEAYCKMYGYKQEDFLGEHFTMVVPPETRAAWIKTHDMFIGGREETKGEFSVLNKYGEEMVVLADSALITDQDGRRQKITFVQDITERKRTENQLKLSEEVQRKMFETAPTGICITNEEGLFEEVNQTYCDMYKYLPEELVGKHFSIVVPPEDRPRWRKTHDKFIEGSETTRGQFNVVDKKGNELVIWAESTRIMGADGKYRKVTFVNDITERTAAEAALKTAEEELRQNLEEMEATQEQMRRSQIELETSEGRFRQLFNDAPVGICVTDTGGHFVSVNDCYSDIYGYTRDEILGKHFSLVVPKNKLDFWKNKHDRFLQGQDETSGEFEVVHKSGRKLTILADSTRIIGADGQPQKVTYVIDISERKKAEEKFQRSEEIQRKLLETAPVGICITNERGEFESINDTYCKIYGYNTEDLIGQSFIKVVPKNKADYWRNKHDKFLAGEDETRGEFNVVHANGKQLTILADSTRIVGMDGAPKKVTFVVDITDRKAAEERLRVSEESQRKLVETAPVGICITNEDGLFESVNETYTEIYKYRPEELIGEHFTKVVPRSAYQFWLEKHDKFIVGQDETRGEFTVIDKNGNELTILAESARIAGADGKVRKVTFVVDITERKQNEMNLRSAEEELRQNLEEMEATQEEMKRSQAELQKSETRFRQLINQAPVGICVTDKNGNFESVNDTYTEIYKYRPEELVGGHFSMVVPARDKAYWQKKHDDFIAGADETTGEFKVVDKHGKELTILADSMAITGADGQPRKVTFVIDITDRKETEQQLQVSEESQRKLFERAPVGICITSEDCLFETVNDSYCEIYGYTPEELKGQPFTLVVPEDKHDYWKKKHDDFMAGTDETKGEFTVVHKSGKRLTILADSARITGLDGRQKKVTFVVDITDRKQAEENLLSAEQELRQNLEEMEATQEKMRLSQAELQQSEKRFRELVNQAPVGICVTTEDGRFESVNDAYCKIYRFQPEELVGEDFAIVVPKAQQETRRAQYEQFFAGEDQARGEYKDADKTGKELTVLSDAARITGADGKLRKVTFVVDITERKKTEEQLKRSEERLNSLISAAPVGVSISNEEGEFELVNDAFSETFSYEPGELIGQNVAELVNPAKREQWREAYAAFMADAGELKGERTLYDRKRRGITALIETAKIAGADGKPRAVMFAVDITERKKTELELKRSEERVASLIETAPVGVSVVDEQGVIESVNEAFAKIYEYQPEELIGERFTMVVPKEKITQAAAQHERFFAGEDEAKGESTAVSRKGKQLTLLTDSARITGADNKPRKVTFVVDITARKEAEQQMERLSIIAEKTDNGIILTDARGQIEWVNEGLSQITGYNLDRLKGEKPLDVLSGAETDRKAAQRVLDGLSAEKPFMEELLGYRDDGQAVWLAFNVTPVFDRRGFVDKYIWMAGDVTQKKSAEKEMQKLSLVASKTDNAVIITDAEGRVEWTNEAFTNISGYSLEESQGKKPGAFLQGADTDPRAVAQISDALRAQEAVSVDILNYSKSGRKYWMNLNITPTFDKDGRLDKFVAVQRDITQDKELEQRKQEEKLKLETANNELQEALDELQKAQAELVGKQELEKANAELEGALEDLKKAQKELVGKQELEKANSELEDALANLQKAQKELVGKQELEKANSELEDALNDLKKAQKELVGKQELEKANNELQEAMEDLKKAQKELVGKQELEKANNELQDAMEDLKQAQAELVGKQELEKANAELEAAMNELKVAQNQLVISEKMAALGQLISGVAHEVNTPISAIKASIRNMYSSLPETMQEMPGMFSKVTKTQIPLLKALLESAIQESEKLSTMEERQYRNEITEILEEKDIDDAEDIASSLVEVGLVKDIDKYVPLFKGKNSMEIIDLVYKLGQLKVSMHNIDTASQKTAKIVSALKNYAYVQASDRLVETDVRESVDTVLTLYHNQLKYGIELVKNYEDTPNIPLYPDEIGQVWTNILHNAIQAMKGEGKFTVDIKEEGEMVRVDLSDNGPGIPEEIVKRVFDPFFTTKAQGEGTGLGLDISRKIVEKHRGEISVDSEPGRTTFTVKLPIKENA